MKHNMVLLKLILLTWTLLLFNRNVNALTREENEAITNKCLKDSRLNEDLALRIVLTGEISNDTSFKNFLKCSYREQGFLEPNNYTIRTDAVRDYNQQFRTRETVDQMLQGCDNLTLDVDEAPYLHYTCVAGNIKKLSNKKHTDPAV